MQCEWYERDEDGNRLPPSCPETGDRRVSLDNPRSDTPAGPRIGLFCYKHEAAAKERYLHKPVQCNSCGCWVGSEE